MTKHKKKENFRGSVARYRFSSRSISSRWPGGPPQVAVRFEILIQTAAAQLPPRRLGRVAKPGEVVVWEVHPRGPKKIRASNPMSMNPA